MAGQHGRQDRFRDRGFDIILPLHNVNESELLPLLKDLESYRVERTISTTNTDKFSEAVCAFANDLPGSRQPGYLFIGADDTGRPSGLKVSDELLRNLAGLSSDGNILPAPAIAVYTITLSSGVGDIAVVEVQPSTLPPVRYKGRAFIRRGPRKGIANEAEETLLIERRTAAARTFDARPCEESRLSDLALDLFTNTYRPLAIDGDIIAENHRTIEHQLASLRFFDLTHNCPTYAGLLLFAKDIIGWLPNAYVQYVRFDGADLAADVSAEKRFQGDLLSVVRDLNAYVGLITSTRPENFPTQTSYRNPILAESLKTLGAVNRFGRGVVRAQAALEKNGSPRAEFIFGDTFFGTTIRIRS